MTKPLEQRKIKIEIGPVRPEWPEHIEFLYQLCKEREEEHAGNISFKMPSYEEHRDFVMSMPYRVWYLIRTDDEKFVGHAYLGRMNEIGVHIARSYRGKGVATIAIDYMLDRFKPLPAIPSVRPGYWVANINPKNKASIKLFKKLGFELGQHSYFLKVKP